jgi:choline dehydrogenase-like flavoprotein
VQRFYSLKLVNFTGKDTFPKTEAETSAQLYWGGGIEFDKAGRIGFLRTKMVGGSSIVYQCLMDRFDDIAFNDWKNESGVDWFNNAEMDKHYSQVESDMVLHTFSPEERNGNAKLFVEACDKLGYKWGKPSPWTKQLWCRKRKRLHRLPGWLL